MAIQINEAKHLVIDRSVATRPRTVTLYELDLFNHASRNIYVDDCLYVANENCIVFRKPGQVVHSIGNYDNLILTFTLNDATDSLITEDFLARIPTFFYPAHIYELKQNLRRIIHLYQYDKASQNLQEELCRFLLLLLSDSFEQTSTQSQEQASRIREVIRHIEQHYAENLRIEDLASLIHLDKYYFIKYFKKRTGMTPQQYLIQKRIREARALLESVDLPIREIADMVGYGNTTHFVSSFTKIVGIPPAQYRANFRLPDDKSDHFEKHI